MVIKMTVFFFSCNYNLIYYLSFLQTAVHIKTFANNKSFSLKTTLLHLVRQLVHIRAFCQETWKRAKEKNLKYGYSLSVPFIHYRISGSTRDSKFLQMIHKYLQADIISKNGCSRLL